jgi:subtilase family serine protease
VSSSLTSIQRGRTLIVTDTAVNQGLVTAAASTTRYYLSTDQLRNTADRLLTVSRPVSSLAAGAASSGSATVTIPSNTTPGDYYLLACADDTLVVTEIDEGNNCVASAATITVTP